MRTPLGALSILVCCVVHYVCCAGSSSNSGSPSTLSQPQPTAGSLTEEQKREEKKEDGSNPTEMVEKGEGSLRCFRKGFASPPYVPQISSNCTECASVLIQAPKFLMYAPQCLNQKMPSGSEEKMSNLYKNKIQKSFNMTGLNYEMKSIRVDFSVCAQSLCNKPKTLKKTTSMKGDHSPLPNPPERYCFSYFLDGPLGIVECPPEGGVVRNRTKYMQECVLLTIEFDFVVFLAGCIKKGTNEARLRDLIKKNHPKDSGPLKVTMKTCETNLCNGVPEDDLGSGSGSGSGGGAASGADSFYFSRTWPTFVAGVAFLGLLARNVISRDLAATMTTMPDKRNRY